MDLIFDDSRWSNNYLSLDNLVYQVLQLSESGERDFNSLTNNASVRVALLDFYNDIKHYKEALKEIKKLQKHVAHVRANESKGAELDKIQNIDSIVVQKYSLLRPTALFNKKKYRIDIESRKLKSCSLRRRESKSASHTTTESDIIFKQRMKVTSSTKLAKGIMKPAANIKILVAEPNIIEFYNCEPGLKYKKTIVVRNVYTQMARFRIEKRPDKTAFDIFVQSMTGGDKEDIAPGMYIKIIVQYTCDPLEEPTELLVLNVKNGFTVPIEIRAHRDPPILQVGTFTSFGWTSSDTFSSFEVDSNTYSDSSELKSSSNKSSSEDKSKSELSGVIKSKLALIENRERSVDSFLPCGGTAYASLDCKKCFVGELAIISTTLKNVGGTGRFFIMSEFDWCFMRIVDMTRRNKLIVPPFAIWPAYFELQANEELTMCIYFFPESYGLQVDELYIVSDNCSVKTIEIMGDGIMLEPRMFEFDKSIKYQWFQTENDTLCTMRYLDLNYEIQSGLFIGAFVITYHCDLSVYYRWEKCNKLLCPAEYKNTVMRKDLDQSRLKIEPDEGVFHPNSSILFKVTAAIEDLPFEHYRSLLRFILEDIPCAAVPARYNYSCTKSKVDRRLCENTLDVVFQEIEVRAKHSAEDESCNERFKHEETLLTASIMNITEYTNTTFTLTNQIALLEPSETSSSDSADEVCRLLKGYGTCDCCRTVIISTAVLRPGGPLFVGVEERFTVSLINQTNKRLKFWWGNIIGPDHTKLKINIEPKFDFVYPGEPHTVKIKCLPLETGVISSLFIPCQFDGIHPVNLSIECTIVSLSVAFYFPLECQESLFMPANLRIEWDSSEYISKYDKKSGEVRLFKQKMKEEKILHDVILNSGESLNKTSSTNSYECEEDALSCETLSEIHSDGNENNQIAGFTSSNLLKGSWMEEKESYGYDDYLPVVPYVDFRYNLIKKHFRYLPLIIEIHVNFQKTTRMRIYLENLTPISSDFSITTRNLWDKTEIHSENSEFSEIMSGMVMSIEPMSGKIMPYDITYFEIVANSNTWGIYTDKITVNIDLLPSFFFWVRIINDDLPISYPICRNSSIKIPKIRFQIYKRGCTSEQKKLLLENTSNIPLYVNWHCFLLNEDEKPFNLIFDMLSPFISMEEYLATNTSLFNLIKQYFSCAFNPYKSKDRLLEIDEFAVSHELSDNLENEMTDGSADKTKMQSSRSETGNSNKVQNSNDFLSSSNDLKVSNKLKDIEFQLSIVPYYGKPDHNVFSIKPVELFLPPKQKRYVYISVNSEKLESSLKKIQCRACGFIRIPPIFRYKDNAFYRKDGHYLPPTQLLLECVIRKPRFILQSNRLQQTFEFHISDFFSGKSELKAKKKISFMNFDEDPLDVQFTIGKPFRIDRISTLRERCAGANATVHPNEILEIELKCALDTSWIEKAEGYRKAPHFLTYVILKKRLLVKFRLGCSEAIEIFIKIIFPSLKISESNINFGEVEVGQVTTATFNIYNLADRSQTFEIRENTKKCKNQIFTFYPNKALLAGQSISEMNVSEVKVNFIPKYPGNFEEEVEIISEIDGLVCKFSLKGSANKLT